MNPVATSIHAPNPQPFLDSAENATAVGQAQFFTPVEIAAALCSHLPPARREFIMDLHFGAGALATGAGSRLALGLDIDARVSSLRPPKSQPRSDWRLAQADLTLWYPLAREIGFKVPFVAINPPFSLQWHTSRLSALADSDITEVAACYRAQGETIDSTLASFLIALDMLSYSGEGFMICNAATARRLFGPPDEAGGGRHSELKRYIWTWMEIAAPVFENLRHDFTTAVLYFSRSHGMHRESLPAYASVSTSDPEAIRAALGDINPWSAHHGVRCRSPHEIPGEHIARSFDILANEYAARHCGQTPAFNVSLDHTGRISTHLTPFQQISGKIGRQLIERLNALQGQTPMSLCVTATSRTALREAVQCGIWKVHPDVLAAIETAATALATEGAPFYRPNPTQSLGWIDEYGQLTCRSPGIGTCQPGRAYVISSTMEETTWSGSRINLAGDSEALAYKGKELLVTLKDDAGCEHLFHVRRDETLDPAEINDTGRVLRHHWSIADLLEHFEVPTPQDIANLRPDVYAANLSALDKLGAQINRCLAAA